MNAAEEIQQAIERLEELRGEAIPGIGDSYWIDDCDVHVDGVGNLGREAWGGVKRTAELIVTLNRTIDAQIAILRAVAEYEGEAIIKTARTNDMANAAITLARAINGGTP